MFVEYVLLSYSSPCTAGTYSQNDDVWQKCNNEIAKSNWELRGVQIISKTTTNNCFLTHTRIHKHSETLGHRNERREKKNEPKYNDAKRWLIFYFPFLFIHSFRSFAIRTFDEINFGKRIFFFYSFIWPCARTIHCISFYSFERFIDCYYWFLYLIACYFKKFISKFHKPNNNHTSNTHVTQ